MKFKELTTKNSAYFIRYYKLVAIAVLITVAVIVGSLVVGDSVRTTLVKRVTERLGETETVIFSRNSFMESGLTNNPLFGEKARGILLTNGFISSDGRLIPVYVWGVNDLSIPKGSARMNQALLKELGGGKHIHPKPSKKPESDTNSNPALSKKTKGGGLDAIVLRLPASGLIPSGSLFVTENYTTSMRLSFDGTVGIKEGGNISMKNEQVIPLNIFVNREELAEVMETNDKINLILSPGKVTADDLVKVWNYQTSGLSVTPRDEFTEISSDRVFLQEDVVATILRDNPTSNRLFSYLANAIEIDNTDAIPYSFVTAIDRYKNQPLQKDEIILSDYSANRLQARPGDRIRLSYFTSHDFKTLKTDTITLRVKAIVPISELEADKTLSADFPGLSDVDRCTDWDSDLPINMDLITDEDEAYWDRYRNTPKAIIAYNAIVDDWGNAYGSATAIRIESPDTSIPPPTATGSTHSSTTTESAQKQSTTNKSNSQPTTTTSIPAPTATGSTNPSTTTESVQKQSGANGSASQPVEPDLRGLKAGMFGIQLIYPREAGLFAAKNGVDFSSLFLALGFFIVVSALLLMLVPLSEMLYKRKGETDLLKALGYSRQRIIQMLWSESAPVVLKASIVGVIAGLLYTTLIMWLLGNVWKGATHTDGFSVYPSIVTILIGLFVGVILSLWILRRVIVRNLKANTSNEVSTSNSNWISRHVMARNLKGNKRKVITKNQSLQTKKIAVILSTLVAFGIIGVNLFILHAVVLFVVAGIVLMGTAAIWGDYLISRNGSPVVGHFHQKKLVWSTLLANKRQVLLSFFTLATGVFIVFSVGLNRKGFADSSQIRTGTGGYTLWCESSVPIYHNMMTIYGREKLALTTLPAETKILQCLRYSADDASCLNLNKVTTPTVLGVDMEALSASDFQIEQCLHHLDKEAVFRYMSPSVYPALIDATVLTWSLMMNLGDTLHYTNDQGQDIAIQLVGTLSNSIFQGHILIDRRFFSEIWEETTGSEVFLLKTSEAEKEEVKTLLSQALNEYGVSVTTTNDRLKQFNTVTDTYLTIFLTLGGLGLLLGIMSFVIVVRKNLAMRRREIALYRTLGFTHKKIEQILCRENRIVPLYAIATGVISSLIGVSTTFMNTGIGVWLLAILFTLFFVLCVIFFVRKQVAQEVLSEADDPPYSTDKNPEAKNNPQK